MLKNEVYQVNQLCDICGLCVDNGSSHYPYAGTEKTGKAYHETEEWWCSQVAKEERNNTWT